MIEKSKEVISSIALAVELFLWTILRSSLGVTS